MSSGGPPWKETLRPSDRGVVGVGLKRSGFARGRVERRAGAIYAVKNLRLKSIRCSLTAVAV